MKQRSPLRQYDEAKYPELKTLPRRQFFRALGVGAVAALLPAAVFAEAPTGPDDVPMPGGMHAPDYFTVQLPTSGNGTVYLQHEQYVTFQVRFTTYDSDFATFSTGNETIMAAIQTAIRTGTTCNELRTAEDIEKMQTTVARAIEASYTQETQATATVENLVLTVVTCEDLGPVDGGLAEPVYPERGEVK
ncbi:MAG: hypothetical protein AUK47_03330 [Deltaproteobacteria bacterium CG2_30_63_29]|nr:MAG: hypothetical protein AUK47_03330 [Deltaproteobacteria bacterium CG2_30_63_29]PJB35998.1 MAG: hypothetical protein CO108_24395 [Deltaproteobacteria bacterium CG_4_9_14_3_um_filter_63_12]